MYNTSGYLLEDGAVVSLETYEKYFQKFVRVYAGTNSAEFRKVELDPRWDYFVLEYAVDADWCATCDEAGVTEGICEGHNDPHQEFIYYKRVELYTYA